MSAYSLSAYRYCLKIAVCNTTGLQFRQKDTKNMQQAGLGLGPNNFGRDETTISG
jgi:hypothetical protein